MSASDSALTQIEKLQQEIAALRTQALHELRARREAVLQEIARVDAQVSTLTGVPVEKKQTVPSVGAGKSIPLQELKALLAAAPDKTLNIRKEGLQLANIKTLARVNPHLLRLGGKGAWPTVTMLQ